jgi:hypothetical protein
MEMLIDILSIDYNEKSLKILFVSFSFSCFLPEIERKEKGQCEQTGLQLASPVSTG